MKFALELMTTSRYRSQYKKVWLIYLDLCVEKTPVLEIKETQTDKPVMASKHNLIQVTF